MTVAASQSDTERARIDTAYSRYRAAGNYAGKWNPQNPGQVIGWQMFKRDVGVILSRELVNLNSAKILDAGCGDGHKLAWLVELGAKPRHVVGVDLLDYQISAARKDHPLIEFMVADLRRVPLPSSAFDVVICSTLFSSILDDGVAADVAHEVSRLLKPSGLIVWYDIRYPSPGNTAVRAYTTPMIQSLFPEYLLVLNTTKLLPPIGRNLGPLTSILYPLLHQVSILRSHYLGTIKLPEEGELVVRKDETRELS